MHSITSVAAQINDGGRIDVVNTIIDGAGVAYALHNGNGIFPDHNLLNNVATESVVTPGFAGQVLGVDPDPISADPLFVDRAGGDFRLLAGSPGIDSGTSSGLAAGLIFTGSAPNRGALERVP